MAATTPAERVAHGMTLDRLSDLTEDGLFVALLLCGMIAAIAIVVLALTL